MSWTSLLLATFLSTAAGYSSLAAPSLRPSLAPRSAAPPRPVVASLLPPAHDDDAHWPAVRKLLPLLGLGALALVPAAAHASSLATVGQVGDSAFVQATSLIFVSEIGDKTFFIATLLAARASRLLTFAGCAGALALMTVISVAIGQIFHAVPAELVGGLPLDDYVAVASFIFFGIKSITDALAIEEGGPSGIDEEREEAEKTLQETGADRKGGWPLVGEAFTLTVAAEIGDRSQIATIALAAAQNPFAVCGAPRNSAQFGAIRCNLPTAFPFPPRRRDPRPLRGDGDGGARRLLHLKIPVRARDRHRGRRALPHIRAHDGARAVLERLSNNFCAYDARLYLMRHAHAHK